SAAGSSRTAQSCWRLPGARSKRRPLYHFRREGQRRSCATVLRFEECNVLIVLRFASGRRPSLLAFRANRSFDVRMILLDPVPGRPQKEAVALHCGSVDFHVSFLHSDTSADEICLLAWCSGLLFTARK